jgi:hypothetical protein
MARTPTTAAARTCRWQRLSDVDVGKRGKTEMSSAATASLLVANVRRPAPRNKNPAMPV